MGSARAGLERLSPKRGVRYPSADLRPRIPAKGIEQTRLPGAADPLELGKDNWDVAFYPVEDHSFTTLSAWADEYKQIFKLFERNLK